MTVKKIGKAELPKPEDGEYLSDLLELNMWMVPNVRSFTLEQEILQNSDEIKSVGKMPDEKNYQTTILNGFLRKQVEFNQEKYDQAITSHFKEYGDALLKIRERYEKESQNNPVILADYPKDRCCLYRGHIYKFDKASYSPEEMILQIKQVEDKERQKFERLKHEFSGIVQEEKKFKREVIPKDVRIIVWNRDGGKCSKCDSRERLEYDHIVPVSMGGSNTARNIELLCETCNRSKNNNIQ